MVDNGIAVTTRSVQNTETENTFQISSPQTTHETLNIQPVEQTVNPAGSPVEMDYDFAASSSGAALGINFDVHHRSVKIPIDQGPTDFTITDFFNNVLDVATSTLHVIPREIRDGFVTYDCFFSYAAGAGLVDPDLKVVTLTVPPGTFPVLPTTTATTKIEAVFREWRGINRIYDVFILDT